MDERDPGSAEQRKSGSDGPRPVVIPDAWRSRLETVAWFVNKVGFAIVISCATLSMIGGIGYVIFTGKVQIKVPVSNGQEEGTATLAVVPQQASKEHDEILTELKKAVTAMTESHEAQTAAIVESVREQKQIVLILRNMRCDMKQTVDKRERCFKRIAAGGQVGSFDD